MSDKFSAHKRSEIMSKVKHKDSKIETEIRKALWHKGFRYRKNVKTFYGKPDLVFSKYKTVIFIDSCFWHGCPEHFQTPAKNRKFWAQKIARNVERDKEVTSHYENSGWQIIRIWEHDIKADPDSIISRIENALTKTS